MNTRTAHAFLAIAALFMLGSQAPDLLAQTPLSLTVTIRDSAHKERTYLLTNFAGENATLPVTINGKPFVFDASFIADESSKGTMIWVTVGDPSVVLPGVAGGNAVQPPAILRVFSATFPYKAAERIKAFESPEYALFIQIDGKKD